MKCKVKALWSCGAPSFLKHRCLEMCHGLWRWKGTYICKPSRGCKHILLWQLWQSRFMLHYCLYSMSRLLYFIRFFFCSLPISLHYIHISNAKYLLKYKGHPSLVYCFVIVDAPTVCRYSHFGLMHVQPFT